MSRMQILNCQNLRKLRVKQSPNNPKTCKSSQNIPISIGLVVSDQQATHSTTVTDHHLKNLTVKAHTIRVVVVIHVVMTPGKNVVVIGIFNSVKMIQSVSGIMSVMSAVTQVTRWMTVRTIIAIINFLHANCSCKTTQVIARQLTSMLECLVF